MTTPMDNRSKALSIVPNRPLASLYDVACLYSACGLYDRLQSDHLDWDIDPRALQNLTPSATTSIRTDPEADNSLIVAYADLSGDEPTLGDNPVSVENYTDELMYQVGHIYREGKTGSATDYSITNHTGTSEKELETIAHDEWGNRFLRGRFESWPFGDVADRIADTHEQGDVIYGLRELGENEDEMDRLEAALLETATAEETEALVTVRVKTDPDEDYQLPGEVPVLNEVGVQRRAEHLKSGISVDDAFGDGTGYVSNTDGEVLGGSSGLLGQYGKKQDGVFPNLQADDCWRSRPLSSEVAAAIGNFGSSIDAFSVTSNGVRLYYLPYPVDPPENVFEKFYDTVYQPLKAADESDYPTRLAELFADEASDDTSPLADIVSGDESASRFSATDSWLRLYGVFAVKSTNPPRTFVDEPNLSLDSLTQLDAEYEDVVAGLGDSQLFGELVAYSTLFDMANAGQEVLFRGFLDDVVSGSPDDADTAKSNRQATADDALFSRSASILRGKPVSLGSILPEFVKKVSEVQRRRSGTEKGFPTTYVLSQYARLMALDEADLLKTEKLLQEGFKYGDRTMDKILADANSREARLDTFIDSHAALDTPEAESVFLLGALVGRLSAYQHSDGVSRKLTEQHPVDAINKQSITRITTDVMGKNEEYIGADDVGQMNSRYTTRLADAMLSKSPDDWNLSTAELRWLYSLGIAYGKQDTPIDTDSTDD